MSYSGYNFNEYDSEARSVLHQKYATGDRLDERAYRAIHNGYADGISPARAAQRAAFAMKFRRKERFWFGSGPRISSGYADTNRVGSKREWSTVMVSESLNSRARYLGRRSIDGHLMNVWRVGKRLYAQTGPARDEKARRRAPPRRRSRRH